MKASAPALAVISPLSIVVGIALGSATGWWRTASSKDPVRFTEGAFAGEANPADMRGSYSLNDVSSAFGISVDLLSRAFHLTDVEEPGEILVKEFAERFGVLRGVDETEREVGTDAMRLFVARYRGLPYEPESDTGMLPAGVALVAEAGAVGEEALVDLQSRVVELPAITEVVTGTDPQEHSEEDLGEEPDPESEAEEILVKGNTTFGELLTWGVAEKDIRAILDGEMGSRGETVRMWSVERGHEFSTLKESLQELVDTALQ